MQKKKLKLISVKKDICKGFVKKKIVRKNRNNKRKQWQMVCK